MKNEIRLAAHEICPGKLSGGRKSKPTTCLELTTFFRFGHIAVAGLFFAGGKIAPAETAYLYGKSVDHK